MTLINLFKPGLGELFGLTVLSLIGITMAFMVMTMASGLESRAMSDLGITPLANAASGEVVNGSTGELTSVVRY
ncbi:MAG: hypothetical protein IH963_14070 [Chloroflexi bacterium]|nr:hypothetical protein [Chloroflexota bacterium]